MGLLQGSIALPSTLPLASLENRPGLLVLCQKFLLRTCDDLGYSPQETLVVGDGANDLRMMSVSGVAVGFQPKGILIPKINGAIFGSHQALKAIIDPKPQ